MSEAIVLPVTGCVGNDVVDLGDPESASEALHPRFDSRVFAAAERAALAVASDENRERWKRWAAKEAAYKVARKREPRTIFSPARFVTEFDSDGSARVTHLGQSFHVTFFERDDAIHAVAVPAGSEPREIACEVQQLRAPHDSTDPDAPRTAVRELVCASLAQRLDVDPSRIEVRRIERIPSLWIDGRATDVDVSLSHHGRFVAFACGWNSSDGGRGRHASLTSEGASR